MRSGVHSSAPDPYFEDHRAETAYIHESSYIDTPCRIGEHTAILHFTHVMAHAIIGDHCLIGRNVSIASGVLVGDKVRVMHNAQLNSGVILENEVYCGPCVVFAENRYIRAQPNSVSRISPTLVRWGAQLGPNSTVASGSTIGRYAFIEAGTIVDRNIPDFAVVYGNPLRLAGWRCECGQSLRLSPSGNETQEVICAYCNRQYQRQSQWKVLQLTQRDPSLDSHSEFDPTVRTAQGQD
ncbi:DapH/DapD/GlmU-related protein [Vampirovibrio sp.]|uniref:acyltransferase n=1 Tax=Vampirovibrio sp. TaxID=2717857 RepID=UPI00359393B7